MLTKPAIIIRIEKGEAKKTEFRFTDSFIIGRGDEFDVPIKDKIVSRPHAEIHFERDTWWVYDLQSANGIFVDGEKVEKAPLANNSRIRMGLVGPVLSVSVEKIIPKVEAHIDQKPTFKSADYYLRDPDEGDIGEHTLEIRQLHKQRQREQKKKYLKVIAVSIVFFSLLLLISGGWAVYKHIQVKNLTPIAIKNFYQMKRLELGIEKVLAVVERTGDIQTRKLLESYKARYQEKKDEYDSLTKSYIKSKILFSEKKQLIFQVAQTFGECGVNMPDEFVKKVMSYIDWWKNNIDQKGNREIKTAIERAKLSGYIPTIVEAMKTYDLPPQFFYIALQESKFNINACGPRTRFGIAKGMWQFIPSTAKEYGLRIGPKNKLPEPDGQDERHDFERSTLAAARYLRFLYETDAKASGLLVMASYNWGARRVIEKLRKMPEDPEKRNFWAFFKKHGDKMPEQTSDYVFKIVSAAVIGEDPRLFGFNFDNPLASVIS